MNAGVITVASRIDDKKQYSINEIVNATPMLLEEIQAALLLRAEQHVQQAFQNINKIDNAEIFEKTGVAYKTSWCTNKTCESSLKEYKASIRCILESEPVLFETCFCCDQESKVTVIVARSY